LSDTAQVRLTAGYAKGVSQADGEASVCALSHDANRSEIVGEQRLRLIEERRANALDDGFCGTFVHAATDQLESHRIAGTAAFGISDVSQ
jgi:hypothetical protein